MRNYNITRDVILLKMIEIFEYLTMVTKVNHITMLELNPITLGNNTYATGFKIDKGEPKIHLKRMKTLQINNDSFTFLNPTMDLWINAETLDTTALITTLDNTIQQLVNTIELHTLILTYKEENNTEEKQEITTFLNKRYAAKYAIQFRKKYNNTKFKFYHTKLNQNTGNDNNNNSTNTNIQQGITDLQFATAPLEEIYSI